MRARPRLVQLLGHQPAHVVGLDELGRGWACSTGTTLVGRTRMPPRRRSRGGSAVAQDPQVPAAADLDRAGLGCGALAGRPRAAGRGRPASRTALASASRSSVVGGGSRTRRPAGRPPTRAGRSAARRAERTGRRCAARRRWRADRARRSSRSRRRSGSRRRTARTRCANNDATGSRRDSSRPRVRAGRQAPTPYGVCHRAARATAPARRPGRRPARSRPAGPAGLAAGAGDDVPRRRSSTSWSSTPPTRLETRVGSRARRRRVRRRGRAARRRRPVGAPPTSRWAGCSPSHGKVPARIVVYRRPVETRANDRRELVALVNDVVVEQVAAMLEVDPHELDPGYESGEP